MAVDKYVTRYEALLLQFRARGEADTALDPTDGTLLSGSTSDDTLSQILQELFGESFQDTTGDIVTTGTTTSTTTTTTITTTTSGSVTTS